MITIWKILATCLHSFQHSRANKWASLGSSSYQVTLILMFSPYWDINRILARQWDSRWDLTSQPLIGIMIAKHLAKMITYEFIRRKRSNWHRSVFHKTSQAKPCKRSILYLIYICGACLPILVPAKQKEGLKKINLDQWTNYMRSHLAENVFFPYPGTKSAF